MSNFTNMRIFPVFGSCVLAIAVLAFTFAPTGAIKGRVLPTDGALKVMVIKGADTVQAHLTNGQFKVGLLKRGVYTVLIKARPTLKDTLIQRVAVIDSATTDMGDVKLTQQPPTKF